MSPNEAPTPTLQLAGLSRREQQRLQALLDVTPPSTAALTAQISEHLAAITREARRNEFLDLALARSVAAALTKLAEVGATADPASQRLVGAAVAYFVDEDDAAHDLSSPIGFEDDARVVNAAARALGRDDLVIALPD